MSEEAQKKRREARVNFFLSKGSNIFTENKLLKFAFATLFLMVMYQQISIPRAIESQRTIILMFSKQVEYVDCFHARREYVLVNLLKIIFIIKKSLYFHCFCGGDQIRYRSGKVPFGGTGHLQLPLHLAFQQFCCRFFQTFFGDRYRIHDGERIQQQNH